MCLGKEKMVCLIDSFLFEDVTRYNMNDDPPGVSQVISYLPSLMDATTILTILAKVGTSMFTSPLIIPSRTS